MWGDPDIGAGEMGLELVPELGPWGNAGKGLRGSACLETGLGAERAPLPLHQVPALMGKIAAGGAGKQWECRKCGVLGANSRVFVRTAGSRTGMGAARRCLERRLRGAPRRASSSARC